MSETFPVNGTSFGLEMTVIIKPIIDGPELSEVTNVSKESDGPSVPSLYQEFSYYMPFDFTAFRAQATNTGS